MSTSDSIAARLSAEGIVLPVPPTPVASYQPYVAMNGMVWVSGQLPLRDGSLVMTGLVGDTVSEADALLCARQCAINILAVLSASVAGDWERLLRVVRLGGFVASTPDFVGQPKIINGASDLIGHVLGDRGTHARAAVGVASLPLGAPVEVEALALITAS
ncbi:MAG: RidA family protein [Alphaproteobacteria bacterium]|nr:RidA family protein [Alphaproteobacteria bacterium]